MNWREVQIPNYGYTEVNADQKRLLSEIADFYEILEKLLVSKVPSGRYRSLMIAAMEESAMWAAKSVAKYDGPYQFVYPEASGDLRAALSGLYADECCCSNHGKPLCTHGPQPEDHDFYRLIDHAPSSTTP
jgi:hypothetical protein